MLRMFVTIVRISFIYQLFARLFCPFPTVFPVL